MLVVGSSIGTGKGYRLEEQICLATAVWHPQDPTLCPDDQEITECQLEPEQKIYTVTLNCGIETVEGQTGSEVGMDLIVFDSTRGDGSRDLYTMNSQGKDLSQLTRGEADSFAGPWSPDGQRIVYTTFGLTNSYIATVNADGSGQSTLVAIDGSDEAFPDWSPDGQRIAFTSRRDGNNEIYLVNADGSNPVRLTNAPGDDFAPSWSPDGTQIVFASDRDQSAGIYDLYIMNADGSGVRRLTNDTAIDYSPDWSPDARHPLRPNHDGLAISASADGSGDGPHQRSGRRLGASLVAGWYPDRFPDGSRWELGDLLDGS
jgi:Tol biopolymer transport system component